MSQPPNDQNRRPVGPAFSAVATALLLLALVLASCGAAPPTGNGGGNDNGFTCSAPPPLDGEERPAVPMDSSWLRPVVGGLQLPTAMTNAGDRRLFVAERAGRVRLIDDGRLADRPFLDISDNVKSDAGEQGLLGLAFPPDYASSGLFYAYYTASDGHGVLSRFHVSADDPDCADAASEQRLVRLEQASEWHNGGQLAFGPDGYLYWAIGDGGASERARDLDFRFGKILRLDVSGATAAPAAGNPFANQGGVAAQVWADGLRNPWRFSFDDETGQLYIADVGQDDFEEVNVQPASSGGLDYGWPSMEGNGCFRAPTCSDAGLTRPAFTYPHPSGGASITGGYVYRGAAAPALVGAYVYADFVSGTVFSAHRQGADWITAPLLQLGTSVATFGQGADGALYVATYAQGSVYELVQAP